MALEGSLKEFNVADILQLIFFQKKTGVLLLQGRYERIRILFFDGNIIGAETRSKPMDKRLVWVLVKRGMIDQEQLDTAIGKQKTEGKKFYHHLVNDNVITKEDVTGIISFLISEVMAMVFSMKEGKYEFKAQAIPVDKEMGVVLNTEHYLMEGVRIVDEWSEIEGKVVVEDVFMRDMTEPMSMTEKEELILDYVDGIYTVQELAEITAIDSFTVAATLVKFEEEGAVLRVQAPEEDDEASLEKARARKQVKPIPGLLYIVWFIFISAIAVSFFVSGGMINKYDNFKVSEDIDAIRLSIEAQKLQTGLYPASVDQKDLWGNSYIYGANDYSFVLRSAGPDGSDNTGDEIR
jgi:hypothetical protein